MSPYSTSSPRSLTVRVVLKPLWRVGVSLEHNFPEGEGDSLSTYLIYLFVSTHGNGCNKEYI